MLLATPGCTFGPPALPTPGPFPVQGVRQLTFDAAFYQTLVWSPDGTTIAGARCPILNAEPACIGQEQTILIDVGGGTSKTVDIKPLGVAGLANSPVAWSPDGQRLLLVVRNSTGASPSFYVEDTVATGTMRRMDIEGTAIAWDESGGLLLVLRADGPDRLALGWLSMSDASFEEEIAFASSEPYRGPYALSPDGAKLLIGDSPLPSTCDVVYVYTIGSHQPAVPFLRGGCLPTWSPDGRRFAYLAKGEQGGPADRLYIGSDQTNPQPFFPEGKPYGLGAPAWSPDGTQLAFTLLGMANVAGVYLAEVPLGLRD
jgi:dipeptidyl aminopeptidase/acylaminoacyl peptidase